MKRLHVITILFFSLAMGTTSAHALEYLQKKNLPVAAYTFINAQLYRYFAVVGGIYCMAAVVLGIAVVITTKRNTRGSQWFAAAAVLQVCWLVSWLLIVWPVNQSAAAAIKISDSASQEVWGAMRVRWEMGHIAGFVFHLTALCSFLAGLYVRCREN